MKRTLAVVLWLLLAGAPLTGAAQSISEREQQVRALQEEIRDITERVERARSAHSRAADELEETERALAEVQSEQAAARTRLQRTRDELEALEAEQQALREALQEQADRLSVAVTAAWKSRQQTPLKAWLTPGSVTESQRMARFYQMFNDQQLAQLRAFEQTETRLAANFEAQQAREQELGALQAELAEQNERLSRRQAEREDALGRLDAEIESASDQLRRKEAEKAELEELIENMSAAIESYSYAVEGEPIAAVRGNLSWPVEGELARGYRSAARGSSFRQEGVTIAAEAGSPVRAIYPGRVVFADYLKGYGLLIILDHGDQYLSLYGRNQTLLRSVGNRVQAGEVIAEVGDTGGFRSPGLYFELRHQGATRNPVEWFAQR